MDKDYVKGNENIKAPDYVEYISEAENKKRIKELIKCRKDPLYFAEHYFSIISIDKGKHIIELYPKQKELIKTMCGEKRIVCVASRQSGKCHNKDTKYTLRNKKTGEIIKINAEKFHQLIQKNKINILENYQIDKFIESFDVEDYEVMTDTGWEDIKASHKTIKYIVWELRTENYKILAADEHKVFDEYFNEVFICELKKDDLIQTEQGLEKVTSIKQLNYSENMYDLELSDNTNHRYYTNGILSHNTTAYNIFALWTALFNPEQSILICANTGESASDFVSRIAMAYEDIPMWLKPGVKEWNKRKLKFSNDSIIMSSATSPAVRGKTGGILILDEFSFIEPGIEKAFWEGVYPIVSSSKKSKVVIVSTPNGTGNLFYQIYDKATLGLDKDGWVPFRIDWWEVPGRDDDWKRQQIASFNGDLRSFNQEYGNVFFGSAQTLIDGKYIKEFKTIMERLVQQKYEPKLINLGIKENELFDVKIFEKPLMNHTYVMGADGGEGIGGDLSTFLIFDISDIKKINLVASYGNNAVSTKEFSYLLVKAASVYNQCYIGIENNGITKSIVDDLWGMYEYDNIITIAEKIQPGKVGISSTHNLKVDSCLWLKSLMKIEEINFYIREPFLINEMEYFERKLGKRSIFQAAGTHHDDFIMAFIWAMKILDPNVIEDYYNVTKWMKTTLGLILPERISQFYDAPVSSSNLIDNKFNSMSLSNNGNNKSTKMSTEAFEDSADTEEEGNWDGPIAFFGDEN